MHPASQSRRLPLTRLAACSAANIARCPGPPAFAAVRHRTLPTLTSGCSCSAILSNAFSSSRVSWHCRRVWMNSGGEQRQAVGLQQRSGGAAQGPGGSHFTVVGGWRRPTRSSPRPPTTALRPHIVCVQGDQPRLAICQVLVEVQVWKEDKSGVRRREELGNDWTGSQRSLV